MNGSQEYENFYAICDHMPGKDRVIRVGGTVICPSSGWSARLERTKGNTGINQFMLDLDLIVIPPPPDEPVRPVITPVAVEEWSEEQPAFEYTQVTFHRSDSDPPPIIDVDHPE